MSHQSQLIKNTFIIAIGKLSTQVMSYLLLPLYTSRMEVADYGTFDFMCTISLFLCPVITFLMEEAMFRFLIDAKDKRDEKSIISQTIIIVTITLTISCILIFLAIKIFSINLGSCLGNLRYKLSTFRKHSTNG